MIDDTPDLRQCDPDKGCGEVLPLEDFHLGPEGKPKNSTCKDCTNAITRERRLQEAQMDDTWHVTSGSMRMACPADAVRVGARWFLNTEEESNHESDQAV